ncbi:ParA family protein [Flexithrix dorotheae]|uniref:ParA family protein n=1 Tax=Flexithrix dorotheae TaxID=70993 RepID=UPI00036EFBCF|nr:ParA family protein [Flexithrix dorotheae]
MAEIISVLNRKGGVGKTTTTINLGKALSLVGKKVLVIDNDAQANLTEGLGVELEEGDPTIYQSYKFGSPLPIIEIEENFDMVPSGSELDAYQNEINADIARNYKLKKAIKPIRDKYDFILIDCPPSIGAFTANAVTASSKYLITAQAGSAFSTTGLIEVKDMIDNDVKEEINENIECLGILVTFYRPNVSASEATVQQLAEMFPDDLLKTRIRFLTKMSEAPFLGRDIFSHAPNSDAANNYASLAIEILDKYK